MPQSVKKKQEPSAPFPARSSQRTGKTTVTSTTPNTSGGVAEEKAEPDPSLPHERDESVSVTGRIRHPEIEQAFEDLERGLQNTDRGLEAHEVYRKQKQK